APQLSFFFAAHSTLLEEVAKFRAARRVWAGIMRDRYGARAPASLALRFHTQTMGSTLTAQQPQNNIVRTAIEALAAVLGGTQSLHTNAYDEALGLPTEESVRIALRTQQIIAEESGVAETIDPLGGAPAGAARQVAVAARRRPRGQGPRRPRDWRPGDRESRAPHPRGGGGRRNAWRDLCRPARRLRHLRSATSVKLGPLHHVAIAVSRIEEALPFYRDTLGFTAEQVHDLVDQHVRVVFLGDKNQRIELIQPTDGESGVAKFVAKHPKPTLHHVCYVVDDLAGTLGRLQTE